MPKLRCMCGNVIDLSSVPVKEEYHYLSASEWDHAVRAILKAMVSIRGGSDETLRERISDTLAALGGEMYRCPTCERIIVFWPGDNVPTFYRPDRGWTEP